MKDQYREPNKSKGEHGYKNRRGLDILADMLGGGAGKVVREKRKHKEKLKNG
jgi:hypothetical protein